MMYSHDVVRAACNKQNYFAKRLHWSMKVNLKLYAHFWFVISGAVIQMFWLTYERT